MDFVLKLAGNFFLIGLSPPNLSKNSSINLIQLAKTSVIKVFIKWAISLDFSYSQATNGLLWRGKLTIWKGIVHSET